MYVSGPDIVTLINTANHELKRVSEWINCNKLSLNIDKSHFIIFHRNKKMPPTIPCVKISDKLIKKEFSTKFLGVTVDFNLSWNTHIKDILTKISKQCGILFHIRNSLTLRALKQIYYSLVFPQLTYCNIVWSGVPNNRLKDLFLKQKKIIRVINSLGRYDHTNAAFLALNILKFNEIKEYCIALFVYKTINSPDNTMFTFRNNSQYCLRNANLLQPPMTHSLQSQSSIRYQGVGVWNSLPTTLREKPTIATFKQTLKLFLLNRYSD